jgi:hypothetical protein
VTFSVFCDFACVIGFHIDVFVDACSLLPCRYNCTYQHSNFYTLLLIYRAERKTEIKVADLDSDYILYFVTNYLRRSIFVKVSNFVRGAFHLGL